MQKKFESTILKKRLFGKTQNLLLAISGGIDSVVLAHLLKKSGYQFAMAHCNFNLRANESDEDEQFCRALAREIGVTIYINSFDTKQYAESQHISIQMAARNLRYSWFKQLSEHHKLDAVLTAHHANDLTETVLINLIRGTGIKGLTGILEKRGNIIRPLLTFNKSEIENYARRESIKFRLDKSNLDDKYERNFIRLNIIPELKKLNPSLENTFSKNARRFVAESAIIQSYLQVQSLGLLEKNGREQRVNLSKLRAFEFKENMLHYIMAPSGFNETQLDDIITCISKAGSTGKVFYSSTHKAAIDRKEIIINPIPVSYLHELSFNNLTELKKCPAFNCRETKSFSSIKNNELIISPTKLIFPLTLRLKKQGDRFMPFGMDGFKLLSDFMREQKMNAFEKEECKVLVNGNGDIVWVVGHRSDERYRVDPKDNTFIKLSLAGKTRNIV